MALLRRLSIGILGLSLMTAQSVSSEPLPAIFYTASGEIDLVNVTIYTCGVGLLFVGAYKLYHYVYSSNHDLMEDCHILLDKTNKYTVLLNILRNYQVLNEQSVPEDALYLISQKIGEIVAIRRYIDELHALERDLSAKVAKLGQRRQQLAQKLASVSGNYASRAEDQRLVDDIAALELITQPILHDLDLLYRCLNKHAGYIVLFQIYAAMNQKYRLELAALRADNIDNLKRLARGVTASEYILYPLIQYSRILKDDSARLAQVLSRVNFNYPVINGYTQELQAQMEHIYRLIVGDSEYVAEQNAREASRQREERLRIERERVELERQTLWLKLQQRQKAPTTVVIHNH